MREKSDTPVDAHWRTPDALWPHFQKVLPPPQPKPKGGRPRMDDRQAVAAIFSVLRTGCQWKALPRSLGAGSTVHARCHSWKRAGVFAKLWQAGLLEYDEAIGLAWEWQAMDGVMTKAPLGGEKGTGPNPTDRAKSGTNRSLWTDGGGIPLGVVVAGANQPDRKLVGRRWGRCR